MILCVISKEVYGEYAVRDIQTNSAWTSNPYESYAIVPEDMVDAIMATRGFCDIELSEDGTEVASFVPREIPVIPEPDPEPIPEGDDDVWEEFDKAYQEGVNSI